MALSPTLPLFQLAFSFREPSFFFSSQLLGLLGHHSLPLSNFRVPQFVNKCLITSARFVPQERMRTPITLQLRRTISNSQLCKGKTFSQWTILKEHSQAPSKLQTTINRT